MTMFCVYLLYSEGSTKSYVGYTNNLNRRIWEHNNHPQKSYTSRFRPWTLVYSEEFSTKAEAIAREKWFKSGVRRVIKQELISSFLNER